MRVPTVPLRETVAPEDPNRAKAKAIAASLIPLVGMADTKELRMLAYLLDLAVTEAEKLAKDNSPEARVERG